MYVPLYALIWKNLELYVMPLHTVVVFGLVSNISFKSTLSILWAGTGEKSNTRFKGDLISEGIWPTKGAKSHPWKFEFEVVYWKRREIQIFCSGAWFVGILSRIIHGLPVRPNRTVILQLDSH